MIYALIAWAIVSCLLAIPIARLCSFNERHRATHDRLGEAIAQIAEGAPTEAEYIRLGLAA